jgi:hypothetical protein
VEPVTRHRQWRAEILLVVATVLLTLLLAEVILRFTPYRHELFLDTADGTPRHYYKADPDAGYDIREKNPRTTITLRADDFDYEIWSNELGCFDSPYGGENDYILLVGDSFTHMFAPFHDKWGTVLEENIGRRVLKCGVNGYGTKQELLKAQRVIAAVDRSPQLIVVGYYWNDLYEDYELPGKTVIQGYLVRIQSLADSSVGTLVRLSEREAERVLQRRQVYCTSEEPTSPRLQQARCWLARHSILFNLVRRGVNRLRGLRGPPVYLEDAAFYPVEKYPWLRGAWERHLNNLQHFKDLAGKHNAQLLIVLLPTKEQVYPFLAGGALTDLERPNRVLAAFLDAERIPYVDLLPALRRYADSRARPQLDSNRDFFWRTDGHLSVPGNRLVGLLVAKSILERSEIRDSRIAALEAKLKQFEPVAR